MTAFKLVENQGLPQY
uniref:Uncharacterized protein n=1 Tax=Anguilla anguilla TaxID=7936 RepID=A0A0E9T095_ANGAN